ncbi:MAG: ATP-binding protein [bacterium]
MKRIKTFRKELLIKSSTENLSIVRDFIKAAGDEVGMDKEIVGKIVLAVDEACTNVIKHAYKYAPDGDIIIIVIFDGSKLAISITDYGLNFDPNIIPVPDIQEYYKQRKVGGLGIFLMKKLMDEVKYANLSDNRNQVTLVKYLI